MSGSRSVRLSDALRQQIGDELMKGQLVERERALILRSAALTDNCYGILYKPKERNEIAVLPTGWLPAQSKLRVQFGTSHKSLHFNGLSRCIFTVKSNNVPSVDRPFLWRDFHLSPHVTVDADSKQARELAAIEAESSAIQSELAALRRQIDGALASVASTGRLIEIWPEIADTVRRLAPVEVAISNLPALVLTDINQKLGLSTLRAVRAAA